MIDLHLHILPAVDDGPADLDASIALARALVGAGVNRAVATPHIDDWTATVLPDRESVLRQTSDLQHALLGQGIDLRIEAGGECYISPELPDRLRAGLLPVWGAPPGVLLVELPVDQRLLNLDALLSSLMHVGPRVLLAHPERYAFVHDDPGALDHLIEAGLLLQVTASAFRPCPYTAAAEALLRRGLVHVVAGDLHDARGVPAMLTGLKRLSAIAGEPSLRLLTEQNPAVLLDGTGSLTPAPPCPPPARRFFSGRIPGLHRPHLGRSAQ